MDRLLTSIGWVLYVVGLYVVFHTAATAGVFTPVVVGLILVGVGAGLVSV